MIEEIINHIREDLKSKGIPDEVVCVMLFETYNSSCGSDTMDKINAIKSKYPEYYPWEAKYNSIPKEVHNAYFDELNGTITDLIIRLSGNTGDGILSQIERVEYKPLTIDSFKEALKAMSDADSKMKAEKEQELNRKKRIWNKHYKKYGLKFRE